MRGKHTQRERRFEPLGGAVGDGPPVVARGEGPRALADVAVVLGSLRRVFPHLLTSHPLPDISRAGTHSTDGGDNRHTVHAGNLLILPDSYCKTHTHAPTGTQEFTTTGTRTFTTSGTRTLMSRYQLHRTVSDNIT
jgi:hypothetical protein